MSDAYKIERGKTLAEQVYTVLCQRIRTMEAGDNRLPSEEDLAKEYGVSRAIIREACNRLNSEGYVNKSPGRGMLAHPSAFEMNNRIDKIADFRVMLSQKFRNVEMQINNVGILRTPRMVGAHPWRYEDGQVFGMDWTYLGDGKKVIYGPFEFAVSAFQTIPEEGFVVRDLPEFAQKFLKKPLSYCAMYVKCGFNAEAARIFGVSEDRPLQYWEETFFDIEDQPVGYNTFYLHPDEVIMSVLTKF